MCTTRLKSKIFGRENLFLYQKYQWGKEMNRRATIQYQYKSHGSRHFRLHYKHDHSIWRVTFQWLWVHFQFCYITLINEPLDILMCAGSLRSVQSVRGNFMEFLFSNCTPFAVVLGFSLFYGIMNLWLENPVLLERLLPCSLVKHNGGYKNIVKTVTFGWEIFR